MLVQGQHDEIEALNKFSDFSETEVLTPERLAEEYHTEERMFVVRLPKTSELVGATLSKSRLADVFDFRVVAIFSRRHVASHAGRQ